MSFCVFSALLSIPSQVNWIHYELESQLKELLFWLHGNIMIWNQNQRVIVLAA